MNKRFPMLQIQLLFNRVLATQLVNVVVKAGLMLAYQSCHLNGCQNIGAGIVGVGMGNTVGCRQCFKTKTRVACVIPGPVDSSGRAAAQRRSMSIISQRELPSFHSRS